jgi:hypothetical protein
MAVASVPHFPEGFGSGERDFARRIVHSRFERWDGFSGFHLTQLSGSGLADEWIRITQGSFYQLDCFRFQSNGSDGCDCLPTLVRVLAEPAGPCRAEGELAGV